MASPTAIKSLRQARRALYLSSFISVAGFSVIIPFFPLYANELLHPLYFGQLILGVALQIGLITSASKITQLFLNPAFGELSDNTGRKPLIVMGLLLYSVIMALYGLMSDFWGFFLLRLLQGVATASVWVLGEALVVDLSPDDKTGRSLGTYMLSMLAGTTIGPFLGYTVFTIAKESLGHSELSAFRLTFFLVAFIAFGATLLVLFLVKDPNSPTQSLLRLIPATGRSMLSAILASPRVLQTIIRSQDYKRNRDTYSIYSMALINGLGTALLLPVMVLFLEDYYLFDPEDIALIVGIIGVVSLGGAPLGGFLSDHLSRKSVVWVSSALVGVFMMLMGIRLEGSFTFILVDFFLLKFGFSVLQPSFRALQNSLVPGDIRGKEFGIVQAIFNFGSVIGPIIGGLLYDTFFMDNIALWDGVIFLGAGYTFTLAGFLAILASMVIGLGIRNS